MYFIFNFYFRFIFVKKNLHNIVIIFVLTLEGYFY